jgi:hypothetical protein
MPTATYFNALFAAGPKLWGYPKWQERTKFIVPPFADEATTELTGLSNDELVAVKAFADRIHSMESPAEVLSALTKTRDNDQLGRSVWDAWAKKHFSSWELVQDVDAVLTAECRHPRQLIGQQDFVSANSHYVRGVN